MTVKLTAFYESLEEMQRSYQADLQMINNYSKVISSEVPNSDEHIRLLKNQLQLMIETIEELKKRR